MNQPPFDTVGDEPIEARIVAWVLGEASAFEAAELERLCEERPELLVFRRRMLALHGLLTEAEASESDHSWKLPAEKRKALDEILGAEKVVSLDSQKEKRIRHSGRRAVMAIAACVAISFFVTRLTPWKHEAEAIIEVKPRSLGISPFGGDHAGASTSNAMTPQFFGTEFNKIKSRNFLEKVVENLELAKRWNVDKEIAIKRLKDNIETRNVRGTDLLSIRVRDADERTAQEITREVVETYKDYRSSIEQREGEKMLAEFKKAVRDQEDVVENQRKALATIVRTKGVVAKDGLLEDAIKRGLDTQDYADAKRKFESDQQLLQSMKLKQISEMVTEKMAEESVVVHEMPLQSESKKSIASARSPAASAPADAPVGRADGTYKVDSAAMTASREPGLQQAARQNQLAKQSLKPRLVPEAPSTPAQPAVAETKPMPPIEARGYASALEGRPGNGLELKGEIAQTPQAKSEMALETGTATRRTPARGREEASGAFDSSSMSGGRGGESFDESVAVLGLEQPVTGEGLSNGLRSGDQAIDRRDVDARLNHPKSEPEAGRKTKSNEEFAAKPPVLAGKDSGGMHEQMAPAKTSADFGDELKLGGASTYTGETTVTGGTLKLDGALESRKGQVGSIAGDKKQALDQLAGNKEDLDDSLRSISSLSHDHTRDALLAQADSDWELSVPADGKKREFEGFINYGSPIAEGSKIASADKSKIEIVREMQYPTEYEPAEQPNVTTGSVKFPETPATPKFLLTDLMEEIPASENPYSTFSLNISDASFQLAKAALAKGERPDPASIKTEQFYNAVDYGDPAPASNEPVAATIEQSAHPVIPGRNLVRVALRTGSEGRSAAQPLRLTLLVDQSGSMVREDRRASMEHALGQLGALLTKNDLVTVVGFSRTSRLLADGMTGDQAAKLGELVNQAASEGGTNLEEAMKVGGQMAERHQLAGAQNRIVLFTDGAANLGDADPARLAEQVKSLRQKGIAFDIAGIGADGLNDRLLSELARNGNGRYYVVGDEKNDSFARQLAGAFRPAAENVKVQVNFNPQRVGKYKLIGFEKDRLKTEDFRNDAVDAAELAAEEAGVAIYQVEPLAEGTGELGEVSVRFRDAASNEMVERSWTISYDSQAAAFDRATPSMQLAGLSLLAAEKLKGGALADAIDFKRFSGTSAFVKQFYGDSPRVGEMLQVIEKLK